MRNEWCEWCRGTYLLDLDITYTDVAQLRTRSMQGNQNKYTNSTCDTELKLQYGI